MSSSARANGTDAVIPAGAWAVDPARSKVEFRLRHLMVIPVRGRFTAFEGTLKVDPGGRADARGSVETASLDTGDAIRDERMRGPEFFDSEANPKIHFAAREIEPLDERTVRIRGELGIGPVAREVELHATRKGARGGHLELELRGELSRREFGIESQQLLDAGISDRVELELSISLAKRG